MKKILLLIFLSIFSSSGYSSINYSLIKEIKAHVNKNGDQLYIFKDLQKVAQSPFDNLKFKNQIFSNFYNYKGLDYYVVFVNKEILQKPNCLVFLYMYDTTKCNDEKFQNVFLKTFEKDFFPLNGNLINEVNFYVILHELGHYFAFKNNYFKSGGKITKRRETELFCDLFALELMNKYYGIDISSILYKFRKINLIYKSDYFYAYFPIFKNYNFIYNKNMSFNVFLKKIEEKSKNYILADPKVSPVNQAQKESDFYNDLLENSVKEKDLKNLKFLKDIKEYRKFIRMNKFITKTEGF